MISFSALVLAALIFCFSRRLSYKSSFMLCSLSARSIDKLSFYLSNLPKRSPHSAPRLHFFFIISFSCFRIANLSLTDFLRDKRIYIPSDSWSYLLSVSIWWYYLTLFLQISIPCLRPTLSLLENVDKASLKASSFFYAY